MGNVCSGICRPTVFSWIRIPFTFGQIEEEEQEQEQDPDTEAFEVASTGQEEENEERRRRKRSRRRKVGGGGGGGRRTAEKSCQSSVKYNGLVSFMMTSMVLFVMTCSASLSHDLLKEKDSGALRLVQVVLMVIGLAIMVSIYKFQSKFLRLDNSGGRSARSDRDNLVLVGIVVFGALSCLYSFLGVSNTLTCCSVWILCQNRELVERRMVKVLNSLFKILYFVGQTVFCMLFNKSSFANSSLARHALMYLQAVNLIFWFGTFVDEAGHVFKKHDGADDDAVMLDVRDGFNACFPFNDSERISQLDECFLRNRSLRAVVSRYAKPILRPFIIEYAILVGESLAHWFLTCGRGVGGGEGGGGVRGNQRRYGYGYGKDGDDISAASTVTESRQLEYSNIEDGARGHDDRQATDDDSRLLDSTQTTTTTPTTPGNGNDGSGGRRPVTLIVCFGMAVLSNLLLCVFVVLPKILNRSGDDTAATGGALYAAYHRYSCVHRSLAILCVLIGYAIGSGFEAQGRRRRRRRHEASFSGLDYMLMCTSAGPIAGCSFQLLAAGAGRLQAVDADLIAAYRAGLTLEVIEVPLQVIFVLFAGRLTVEAASDDDDGPAGRRRQRDRFRAVVTFLALSNGCQWCINTFNFDDLALKTLNKSFGFGSSVAMRVVITPVSLFYRFNSCLMLARIFVQTRSK